MAVELIKPRTDENTDISLYREYRPYMNLSIAIIARACQDYAGCNRGRRSERKLYQKKHAERFFRSGWYKHLDFTGRLDPDKVMAAIDENRTNSRSFRVNYCIEDKDI